MLVCLDGGVGCCFFDERVIIDPLEVRSTRGWCGGASAGLLVDYTVSVVGV